MRNPWRVVATATVWVMAGGTALAQSCDVGRYGMYDISSSASDTDRANSFRRLFCQQNFSSSSDASKFAATIGIPFGDIPVQFGANQSQNSFRQSYATFCDDQAYNSQFRQKTEQFIQRINPSVVAAMNACLLQRGLHAWIEQSADPMEFTFRTTYVPIGGEQFPSVKSFNVNGAKCQNPPTNGMTIGPQGWETYCERQSASKGVTIVLNASSAVNKDTPLSLAALPAPPKIEAPKPRSTITIAAVDYVRGMNVAAASGRVALYGAGEVLLNAAPYEDVANMAEWRVTSLGGRYRLEVEYAAAESRPVTVKVNGEVWRESALAEDTKCWTPDCQRPKNLGELTLREGDNLIRFERPHPFPHLRTLKLIPVN